jgi:hypothetical protein
MQYRVVCVSLCSVTCTVLRLRACVIMFVMLLLLRLALLGSSRGHPSALTTNPYKDSNCTPSACIEHLMPCAYNGY